MALMASARIGPTAPPDGLFAATRAVLERLPAHDIRLRGKVACLITMSPDYFAEHSLRLQDAVAYGDSMSDVFPFREVGLGVSVNGEDHLAELADIAVEGSDLMLAYRAARTWCDGETSAEIP